MDKKIAIVGGGIGGLTTAIALQKKGTCATVFEKGSAYTEVGAGIVLGSNAMKVLDSLGVGDAIKKNSFSTNTCTFYSEKGKQLTEIDYNTTDFPTYTFIHRYDLIQILSNAISSDSIKFTKTLSSFHQNEDIITLYFDDGTEETTHGLIASDGIHSIVRKKMLPHKKLRFAGYTCWRGILENCTEFISRTFTETWGPKGRFGIVPLPNNRIYWYALKNCQENDPELSHWKTKDLLFNFISYHAPIPTILERTNDANVIQHDIYDLDPLFQYCFRNILLLGDAAHATTPNLGQGACQAIEDALFLSLCFEKHHSIETAFMDYEQQRLRRTQRVVQDSWLFGKVAQIDIPLLCSMRNQMMRVTPTSLHHNKLKSIFDINISR